MATKKSKPGFRIGWDQMFIGCAKHFTDFFHLFWLGNSYWNSEKLDLFLFFSHPFKIVQYLRLQEKKREENNNNKKREQKWSFCMQ